MKTALLIEDDSAAYDSLSVLLEKNGYRVVRAEVEAGALCVGDKALVDIVIADLSLPVMRDQGFATIMGLLSRFPDTKILAISGEEDALEKARNSGAHLTFRKPFPAEKLLAAIEDLLAAASYV